MDLSQESPSDIIRQYWTIFYSGYIQIQHKSHDGLFAEYFSYGIPGV